MHVDNGEGDFDDVTLRHESRWDCIPAVRLLQVAIGNAHFVALVTAVNQEALPAQDDLILGFGLDPYLQIGYLLVIKRLFTGQGRLQSRVLTSRAINNASACNIFNPSLTLTCLCVSR